MAKVKSRIEYEEEQKGVVYEGEWDEEGRRHGRGSLSFSDGSKYKGEFKAGLFHGLGRLEMTDGAVYEGEFLLGKFHGHGVYQTAVGMRYQGQFIDGRAKGKGLVTLPDGSHGNPRQEGVFEGEQCKQRKEVKEDIRKAGNMATQTQTLIQQYNL